MHAPVCHKQVLTLVIGCEVGRALSCPHSFFSSATACHIMGMLWLYAESWTNDCSCPFCPGCDVTNVLLWQHIRSPACLHICDWCEKYTFTCWTSFLVCVQCVLIALCTFSQSCFGFYTLYCSVGHHNLDRQHKTLQNLESCLILEECYWYLWAYCIPGTSDITYLFASAYYSQSKWMMLSYVTIHNTGIYKLRNIYQYTKYISLVLVKYI